MPTATVQQARFTGGQNELLVAYRFLLARRIPAWPLLPMPYDLLVDTGGHILRVSVKTGHPRKHGFECRLTKRRPNKTEVMVPIAAIDVVCIVCDPNRVYVVPATALTAPTNRDMLCSRVNIGASSPKWAPYLNAFAVGAGFASSDEGTEAAVATLALPWYPERRGPQITDRGRRVHRYLPLGAVHEVLRARATGVSATVLAEQFGVTAATIRNLCKRQRKDLRPLSDPLSSE